MSEEVQQLLLDAKNLPVEDLISEFSYKMCNYEAIPPSLCFAAWMRTLNLEDNKYPNIYLAI